MNKRILLFLLFFAWSKSVGMFHGAMLELAFHLHNALHNEQEKAKKTSIGEQPPGKKKDDKKSNPSIWYRTLCTWQTTAHQKNKKPHPAHPPISKIKSKL